MSTDDAVAGMPNQINPKDILWGRQGLGANYFGEELIAEAVWEVFEVAELSKLRNFVAFPNAFIGHAFSTYTKPTDDYPELRLKLGLTDRDTHRVMGVGTFGTRYGLAKRDGEPVPERWVFAEEWDVITCACDQRRKTDPDHLPSEQVTHMNNFRVFLTQSKKLIVFACDWSTRDPQPKHYMPFAFTVDSIELLRVFDLTKEGVGDFCSEFDANAGLALLCGFNLQLQSTNYQVRQELEENEKAEAMAKALLARIKS